MNVLTKLALILREKTDTGSKWTKWFWYILAGLTSLAVVIYLLVLGNSKSNEVAKALHERDVSRKQKELDAVDTKVAVLEEEKKASIEKATEATAQAQKHLDNVELLEEKHKTNKEIINSLKDWDDVQKRTKF